MILHCNSHARKLSQPKARVSSAFYNLYRPSPFHTAQTCIERATQSKNIRPNTTSSTSDAIRAKSSQRRRHLLLHYADSPAKSEISFTLMRSPDHTNSVTREHPCSSKPFVGRRISTRRPFLFTTKLIAFLSRLGIGFL